MWYAEEQNLAGKLNRGGKCGIGLGDTTRKDGGKKITTRKKYLRVARTCLFLIEEHVSGLYFYV